MRMGMPLPDAQIDTLIDELRALPTGDQRAVFAKLNMVERERIRARLRGAVSARAATPAQPSPWSQDIADLVADGAKLTALGRAALARAAVGRAPTAPPARAPSPPLGSLLDRLVARFWAKL